MKKICISLFTAIVIFFSSSTLSAQEKIAFIDLNFVYSNSKIGKKIIKEIDTQRKNINKDFKDFQNKLNDEKKKLLAHLSNEYTDQLKNLHYSDDKRLNDLVIALLSLTDSVTNQFFTLRSTNSDINCLIDIKKRLFINYESDTDLCELVKELNIEIIKKSFPTKRNDDVQMEKGLILLESLNLLEKGLSTDFGDLKLSLSMLTKIGLIDLVNEISTELIALNFLKKMVL